VGNVIVPTMVLLAFAKLQILCFRGVQKTIANEGCFLQELRWEMSIVPYNNKDKDYYKNQVY